MRAEEGLLTIEQIAQMLSLPASTVRYYRDKLAMFLPVEGKGRRRLYPREAKDILGQAARLVREHGYSLEQVRRTFAKKMPITIDAGAPKRSRTSDEKTASELRAVRSELAQIRRDQNALDQAQKATLSAVRQLTEQVQLLAGQLRRRK
jgi:DNA-binding transcriptional MerR regulator